MRSAVADRSKTVVAPHLIDGREDAEAEPEPVLDAPDHQEYARAPRAGGDAVEAAVMAAGRALETAWRGSTAAQRARVLNGAAEALRAHRAAIANDVVLESGKPIGQAESEVERAASALEVFAATAHAVTGTVVDRSSVRAWGFELREPVGVVGVIGTWNLPIQLGALKVGAALAAGCTVVVKPSPLAPLAALHLVRALHEAGLPRGAASVVQGEEATAQALIGADGVNAISFTGRDSTGREVMALAARGPKKVILELGGKSANVVFADADLDAAARGIVAGIARNQGATCTAGSRILVDRRVAGDVLERVTALVRELRVGDPFERATEVGAIRTQALGDLLRQELREAEDRGGAVVCGGEDVDVPGREGTYIRPAVVAGLKPGDRLAVQELFGPIGVVFEFDSFDEALALANASRYGLAAGIWSRDLATIRRAWSRLDVGTVYVNSYHRIDGLPLTSGGRKASGFGLEGGLRGVEELLTTKSVHFPVDE